MALWSAKKVLLLPLNEHGNPLLPSQARLEFWNRTSNKEEENGQTISHRSDEKKFKINLFHFAFSQIEK